MSLYFIPKYQMLQGKGPLLSDGDISNIDALSNLSEQVRQLTALLELPEDEVNERASVRAEVLQVLRKYYPDASIDMFGSTINSFGMKGCNLDLLFLPSPTYCHLDYVRKEAEKEKIPLPDPESVLKGAVPRSALDKLDGYSHLKFIRNVLRNEKVSKRANFNAFGKFPILRLTLRDKIGCEISATNRMVVFNSELLQIFEKLDNRVKPLVICLRYWARSLGFIKRSFFSDYSFTLLVIFFLQSVSSPILPSVRRLTEISGSSRMTQGWETAFATDVQRVPKSKDTQTIGELLTQFFDFYFHFDFSRYIVSPHDGKPLLIEHIKNSKDERMKDFEFCQLNIQDVFILSRNVCRVEKLVVFKLALLTAHEMMKKKEAFHSLFDSNAYQRILDLHYKCMTNQSVVSFIHLDYECVKKFDCLQTWYEKACGAIYDILQCGLLMECEVTDKVYPLSKRGGSLTIRGNNNSSKTPLKKNVPDQSSTPYDLELLVSIQCVLYSRTYIGRKNVQCVASDSQEDDLEVHPDSVLGNEYCISRSLLDKNPSLKNHVPVLYFRCDCYKHANPELKDLVVILKPLSVSREFVAISGFLASFLPKTVKKILMSN